MRLTLNMLLSFAQFEREGTGERIRESLLWADCVEEVGVAAGLKS